jgi:tetratricopeptide (TPR) repeat protein
VTAELIQRQEYHAARRMLTEALTDADCPAALQRKFSELLSATHSGEVGQLTAEAIRRMQEGREAEALATLDRAEELLSTIADDGLPERRRQELERRLWWGYTKVGMRWLEAGMYEEALAPLLHALGFSTVGAGRLDEARRPLAQALESLVEARGPIIEQLAQKGDREAARAAGDKLRGWLRDAMERGVTRDELAGALAKSEQLFERLGEPGA